MIDQKSRIKSNQQVLQLKSSRLRLQTLMVSLCVLGLSICSVQTATCPASVPSSAAITTEQYSYSGYTTASQYGIVAGLVSNNLYYMQLLNTPTLSAVVRKIDIYNSLTWMASFAFEPQPQSLSIDSVEQSVYLASATYPAVVLQLAASTGSIVSQNTFPSINGNRGIYTFPLSDLSSYYVFGMQTFDTAKLCKYTFSSSTAQCQTISNIYIGYGQLMVSNSQFFVVDAASSTTNLHTYKITYLSTSVDWANEITCTSGPCGIGYAESMLSSDGTTIYTYFPYGAPLYLYFVGLSVSSGGVVTTRYKSNLAISYVWGSVLNGDYVIVTALSSPSNLLVIYSISSTTFIIKSTTSGSTLFKCTVEPSSGKRLVVGGSVGNNGYTSKLFPGSINSNPDYSSTAFTMTALSVGTDDINAQVGITIATPDVSFTPVAGAYANQSVTYTQGSTSTSDYFIQTEIESFSVSELTTSTQTPILSCSFSGSTSIVYSLSSYNGGTIPSFVSIDSATGVLSISAPSVLSSTIYSFYVDSTISGISGVFQKIINLTVNKCTSSNCQICTVTDSTVCATCNSGYNLSSGSCNLVVTPPAQQNNQPAQQNNQSVQEEIKASEVATTLSTTSQVAVESTLVVSVISSFSNVSSMASLWSAINQMQLLFFLFITGVFIPKDVEEIITGLTLFLNPFSFLQTKFKGDRNFISSYFNFGLENSNLEFFNIKSDSTIVNLTSFFTSIMIICILHFLIFLTQKLLPKESKLNILNYGLLFIHSILQKLMVLFTFTLYIRIILETNQFILLSSVSEMYQFKFSGIKRIISISIAFLAFIGCVVTIISMVLLALSKDADKFSESSEKRSRFAHMFDGISLNKKSRLFACLLQIRRAIFVILLITVGPQSSIIVISILVGLQLIYFVILVTIRPYRVITCNVIEITNELYFLVILAPLLKYKTAADWQGTPTAAYTWLVSSNSLVIAFFMLGVQPFESGRFDNSGRDHEPLNVQTNKAKPEVIV